MVNTLLKRARSWTQDMEAPEYKLGLLVENAHDTPLRILLHTFTDRLLGAVADEKILRLILKKMAQIIGDTSSSASRERVVDAVVTVARNWGLDEDLDWVIVDLERKCGEVALEVKNLFFKSRSTKN